MNYVRIVIFTLLSALGGWVVSNDLFLAFSGELPAVVEVSGLLNIMAGVGCLFIGIYITIYAAKEQFNLAVPVGDINKVCILGITLSAVLSVILHISIFSNISVYTECESLRKISSRYSSRTYAISDEVCLQEVIDKNR